MTRRVISQDAEYVDWDGDVEIADVEMVEYVAYGISAVCWPGQRADVVYVPILYSAHPGSGKLGDFLTELRAAVAPCELAFVNVINGRLADRLEREGFRLLTPEDAFEDDGVDGRLRRRRERRRLAAAGSVSL